MNLKWLWSPFALMKLFTFYGGGDGSGGAPDPLNLFDAENPALGTQLPDPLGLMEGSAERKSQGKSQTATTSTSPNYTPEERAARADLIQRAIAISNSQQGKLSDYLQPSANTQQGQQMTLNAATGAGSTLGTNAANAINLGTSGALLDPANVPGYNGAVNAAIRPITNAFTDPGGVLSKIRGSFINSAPGGQSSREGIASGIAGREYMNAVGDVSSKMALDQYGKGLDFMGKSLSLAPSTYSLLMQPGATVAGVGQQQEAYGLNQFNAPWQEIQPYINMLNSFSGGNGTTTTSTAPPPNAANSNMQALGTAAMIAAMFI